MKSIFSLKKIQLDIKPRLSAHIVNEDGLVYIMSLSNVLKTNHFNNYTSNRTLTSERGTFWSNTTYALATKVWNLNRADIPERSSAIRIIFNKLWQPWNQKRFSPHPDMVSGECINCNQPDSYEHLLCKCTHPQIQQMMAEGKQAWTKLFAYAEDELTKTIYQILNNMLQQEECANIYLSIWNKEQVKFLLMNLHFTTLYSTRYKKEI